VIPGGSLRLELLNALLGCVLVYGALFGVGEILLRSALLGVGLLIISALCRECHCAHLGTKATQR